MRNECTVAVGNPHPIHTTLCGYPMSSVPAALIELLYLSLDTSVVSPILEVSTFILSTLPIADLM